MRDLVLALGLVLALEGLAFAAFPDAVKTALADASEMPRDRMRVIGIICAAVGVSLVWIVRALLS